MNTKIWLTSDLHLGHNRAFLYEPRGFTNIEDHDNAILENWNNVVNDNDEVYILGDLMLNDNEHGIEYLKQLKGKKHIILGNHDTDTRINLYKEFITKDILYANMIKYKKYHFYLSHYPTICANNDIDKPLKAQMINLCGHSHTKNKFTDMNKGVIYHCELDCNDCYPVSIDNIIEDIKNFFSSEK